jgi:hypothetical protein
MANLLALFILFLENLQSHPRGFQNASFKTIFGQNFRTPHFQTGLLFALTQNNHSGGGFLFHS